MEYIEACGALQANKGNMKILTVSTRELYGGAARAAHRLHLGMRSCSVDSHMLVQNKESNSPFVLGSASLYAKFFHIVCPLARA